MKKEKRILSRKKNKTVFFISNIFPWTFRNKHADNKKFWAFRCKRTAQNNYAIACRIRQADAL